MEGNWRVPSRVGLVLACCAVALGAGCGSDSSGSSADGVETRNPEATFAPLVRLAAGERWLPMDADWFLDRSIFGFAEDQGCADRAIAVGRQLEDLWTPAVDWLGEDALGTASGTASYYRTPYAPKTPDHDATLMGTECPFREGYRYFANQQTRLYEEEDRVEGLRLTEGYYLDLVDRARGGPRPRPGNRIAAPAYVERHAEDVEGEPGLRLTYWLLYGMHAPLDGQEKPIEARTHEGDWERVEILLQEGGENEWAPAAVRLHDDEGSHRDVPWGSVRRAANVHPMLVAGKGDHTPSHAPRGDEDCGACRQWPTWSSLVPAQKQPWYGFGGSWGEVGTTSDTTGPHGPHRKWAPDSPFNAET